MAPPAPPPVDIQLKSLLGVWSVTVKNTGTVPLQLNQVIANNLAGDPDCDVKVFTSLAANASRVVAFPRCGVVRSVDVKTGIGDKSLKLQDSDFLTARLSNNGYGPAIELTNQTGAVVRVDQVIANGQAGDTNCDIKVFSDIANTDYLLVSIPSCGQIRNALVKVGDSSYSFDFE